jgi:NTP pyrophosphatase (non-canonical NTP hydrolase)
VSDYQYIEDYYEITFNVGMFVTWSEPGVRFGDIGVVEHHRGSDTHYVKVRFNGEKHAVPCHPRALEIIPPKQENTYMVDFMQRLRASNVLRDAEWDPSHKIDMMFRFAEMIGEAGEVGNVVKKMQREILGLAGSRATVGDLADELSDVIICCDLIAMMKKINLQQAIPIKFDKTSIKYELKSRFIV